MTEMNEAASFVNDTKFVYATEVRGMQDEESLVGVLLARIPEAHYDDIGPYVRADGRVAKYIGGRDAKNFYAAAVEDAVSVNPERDQRGIFIGHVSGDAYVGIARENLRDGRIRFVSDKDLKDIKIASKFYPFNKKKETPVSAVVGLTDEQKKDLSKQALEASKRLGYCDETKNVLRAMGLPTEVEHVERVTVELEVTSAEGKRFGISNLRYDSPTGLVRVTDSRVVKRDRN